MQQMNVSYSEMEMQEADSDYNQLKDELIEITNHKTFPQLFINGTFYGGYKEFNDMCSTNKFQTIMHEIGMTCEIDF